MYIQKIEIHLLVLRAGSRNTMYRILEFYVGRIYVERAVEARRVILVAGKLIS